MKRPVGSCVVQGEVDVDRPVEHVAHLTGVAAQLAGQLGVQRLRVRGELVVIVLGESDDELVRHQPLVPGHELGLGVQLPLQSRRDLDRLHVALERPGEHPADRAFDLLLEALEYAHVPPLQMNPIVSGKSSKPRDTRSAQGTRYRSGRAEAPKRCAGRLRIVLAFPGWFAGISADRARVAERQTRWLQVPVSARTWGFKSPLAHQPTPGRRHLPWPTVFGSRSGRARPASHWRPSRRGSYRTASVEEVVPSKPQAGGRASRSPA